MIVTELNGCINCKSNLKILIKSFPILCTKVPKEPVKYAIISNKEIIAIGIPIHLYMKSFSFDFKVEPKDLGEYSHKIENDLIFVIKK